MSDVMTPEQRSRCMSRIKGRNTKPELALRRALWARGHRYRVNHRLPGKPDVAFVGARVAVFIDGCFWHGCPEHRVKPKTNPDFWRKKLSGNVERDRKVSALLAAEGWIVLRFWEHEVEDDLRKVVDAVEAALVSNRRNG